MADESDLSERMASLQKMRLALIMVISTETSKLLSRRQRVSGKEIEVMRAERDLDGDPATEPTELEALRREEEALRQALLETEQDIERLDGLMVNVNADIAALRQS